MKQLFTLMACLLFSSLMAQTASDTIYKKNKEVVLAKIVEIGIDEVKYSPQFNPNNLVLVIDKTEIERIVFANGMVQTFADPMKDKSTYADNRTQNLKFNYLSPTGDRIQLNYEKSIAPGMSYEVGLNAIGVGKRFGKYTPVGALVNAGIRFYRMPEMKSRSDRYSHLLNGSYFQPTISFGRVRSRYDITSIYWDQNTYTYTSILVESKVKSIQDFFLFQLNFGKQFVFNNRITFDVSSGVGYGTYSGQREYDSYYYLSSGAVRDYYTDGGNNAYEYYDKSRYGFAILSREVPLCFNLQLKLGYLIK
jgi:hypothetical protein